ncbi:hypothetical protein V8C44DRAFT_363639 [Trichoderma aethiopicum]
MPRRRPRAPRARGAHNLGPFEKPGEPYRMSHIRKWEKYGVGDVDLLWGPYWERFNTVQIPILGETDYFNYALEIAKLAQGSEEEFERIYTRRNKERLGEFLELLEKADDRAFWKHEEFPCEDAADKICAVCKTGALEDFARLLRGITFGWEADIAHDAQPDAHLSECEEAAQSSDSYSGSDYGYWNRLREESEEWKDPRFREEMAACVQPLGVVFFSSTGATLQPFPGATPKDTAEHTESAPYATADQGPTAQKQPPLLPGSASAAEEDEVERLDMTKLKESLMFTTANIEVSIQRPRQLLRYLIAPFPSKKCRAEKPLGGDLDLYQESMKAGFSNSEAPLHLFRTHAVLRLHRSRRMAESL